MGTIRQSLFLFSLHVPAQCMKLPAEIYLTIL